jgi:hypothetical protein
VPRIERLLKEKCESASNRDIIARVKSKLATLDKRPAYVLAQNTLAIHDIGTCKSVGSLAPPPNEYRFRPGAHTRQMRRPGPTQLRLSEMIATDQTIHLTHSTCLAGIGSPAEHAGGGVTLKLTDLRRRICQLIGTAAVRVVHGASAC